MEDLKELEKRPESPRAFKVDKASNPIKFANKTVTTVSVRVKKICPI